MSSAIGTISSQLMEAAWGVVLLVGGGIAWLGQVVNAVSPDAGARWGLAESRESVDRVIWVDNHSEAIWDALSLWTLPLAGLLLLLDHPVWPYLGLVGSGMYLYFAGRAVLQRSRMARQGVRVGTPGDVRRVYLFMAGCAAVAFATIGMAVAALR